MVGYNWRYEYIFNSHQHSSISIASTRYIRRCISCNIWDDTYWLTRLDGKLHDVYLSFSIIEIRLTSVEISHFLSGWLQGDNGNALFNLYWFNCVQQTTIVWRTRSIPTAPSKPYCNRTSCYWSVGENRIGIGLKLQKWRVIKSTLLVQVPGSQYKGEWQDVHQYWVLQVQYALISCLPGIVCSSYWSSTVHSTSTIHSTVSLTGTAANLCWFNYQCNCSNLCWFNHQFRWEISKQIDNSQYFRIGLLIATVQSSYS